MPATNTPAYQAAAITAAVLVQARPGDFACATRATVAPIVPCMSAVIPAARTVRASRALAFVLMGGTDQAAAWRTARASQSALDTACAPESRATATTIGLGKIAPNQVARADVPLTISVSMVRVRANRATPALVPPLALCARATILAVVPMGSVTMVHALAILGLTAYSAINLCAPS